MKQFKLNIGCGYKKKQGFVNIDISKDVKPDLVLDLDKEDLPYEDNSVDYIELDNVFEHFENPIKVLKEFYRVCKPNAQIWIAVPYKFEPSDTFFHKTVGFHEKTFRKFAPNTIRPYYTNLRFNTLAVELIPYKFSEKIPFKRYLKWFVSGIYREIRYNLEVVKDE